MYGVEAASTGGGGLAAQVPGGDLYFGAALAVHNQESGITGTPPTSGVSSPWSAAGAVQTPTAFSGAAVSASGSAVQQPVSQQQGHWTSVLDFHNSVAPWILLAILVLYGWLHASVRVRASAGRKIGAGAGVVL